MTPLEKKLLAACKQAQNNFNSAALMASETSPLIKPGLICMALGMSEVISEAEQAKESIQADEIKPHIFHRTCDDIEYWMRRLRNSKCSIAENASGAVLDLLKQAREAEPAQHLDGPDAQPDLHQPHPR